MPGNSLGYVTLGQAEPPHVGFIDDRTNNLDHLTPIVFDRNGPFVKHDLFGFICKLTENNGIRAGIGGFNLAATTRAKHKSPYFGESVDIVAFDMLANDAKHAIDPSIIVDINKDLTIGRVGIFGIIDQHEARMPFTNDPVGMGDPFQLLYPCINFREFSICASNIRAFWQIIVDNELCAG